MVLKTFINSGSLKIERVVAQLNENNNNEVIKKYKEIIYVLFVGLHGKKMRKYY